MTNYNNSNSLTYNNKKICYDLSIDFSFCYNNVRYNFLFYIFLYGRINIRDNNIKIDINLNDSSFGFLYNKQKNIYYIDNKKKIMRLNNYESIKKLENCH